MNIHVKNKKELTETSGGNNLQEVNDIISNINYLEETHSVKIISNTKWRHRLWFIISNPFCYIFKRYIRF
jgi:hypothetical protein